MNHGLNRCGLCRSIAAPAPVARRFWNGTLVTISCTSAQRCNFQRRPRLRCGAPQCVKIFKFAPECITHNLPVNVRTNRRRESRPAQIRRTLKRSAVHHRLMRIFGAPLSARVTPSDGLIEDFKRKADRTMMPWQMAHHRISAVLLEGPRNVSGTAAPFRRLAGIEIGFDPGGG